MNFREEILTLKAQAPAIARAAIEAGVLRPGPKVKRGFARRGPRCDRRYRELRNLPNELYRLNARLKRQRELNGQKAELLTELLKPRPGEVCLKEWISSQAERLGISQNAMQGRFSRKQVAPSQIRRVTKRTIFVVP